MAALRKVAYIVRLESSLECFWSELMDASLKSIEALRRLNSNELKELFPVSTNMASLIESFGNFTDDVLNMPFSSTEFLFHTKIENFWRLFEGALASMGSNCREMSMIFEFGTIAQILRKTLPIFEKALQDHLDTDFEALAGHYDILGRTLYLSNDYSGAIESHQYAIKVREENFGDHVDTSTSLASIGCVHFEMSNEIEGDKSFQSAFELRKQLGVYDHTDTANIYCTLGDKHFTLGNYKKAIEAHLQALELRKKHLGEHTLTGETLHKIAKVYYDRGIHSATGHCNPLAKVLPVINLKEAETFCQQALAMRLELLGEHMDTAKSLHLLGRIHCHLGDTSSAVEAFQTASNMTSNLLDNHPDTVQSYHWLGLVQCKMGDPIAALESLRKALQMERNLSLVDHTGIPDITNSMGMVYHKMGDYCSAREQFEYTVDLYQKLLGKHESTATSYHDLGETLLALRSYPEALECFKQASTMRLDVLGQHVHTANSFHMLGEVHYNMGDFPSAVVAFQKASEMRSTVLGHHQDTAESYHGLEQAQSDMGGLK